MQKCLLNLFGTVLNLTSKTQHVLLLIYFLDCVQRSWSWVLGMAVESIKVKFTKLSIALKVFVWKEVALTNFVVRVKHGLVSKEEHFWVFKQSFWRSHTDLKSCSSLGEAKSLDQPNLKSLVHL